MRRKRIKLHLRNSVEIFRSINSIKQHVEVVDWQQQGRPQTDKAHNEMLQPFIVEQSGLPSVE